MSGYPRNAHAPIFFIKGRPGLVHTARFTDYRAQVHLAEHVRDPFAILKIGSGVTRMRATSAGHVEQLAARKLTNRRAMSVIPTTWASRFRRCTVK
ncbi:MULTISPECIES: class II D-tagatose-bisphosphate aldolase non-catalytic subunit [Mycetohabitans]|uniref:class II D-tagatose-bisphosphate aldolase non-catalytic subunit n=1 Tax=Mycetohabitans TaxID=2571159 RepID=UPI0032443357|nr:hypothetical protein [Mycetohabitans sp. B3]